MITKPHHAIQADFIIYKKGSDIKAIHGETGNSFTMNSDFKTVIDACTTELATKSYNGHINIKSGLYTVSDSITVPDSIRISGQGKSHNYGTTRLTLDDNVNASMFILDEGYNIIDNLFLSGNKANNTAGHGIFIDNATGSSRNTLHDLVLVEFEDSNILIENGYETVLRDILTKSSNDAGLATKPDHGGTSHLMASNIESKDNAGNGIEDTTMGIHLVNARLENNSEAGIACGAGSTIMNSYIYDNDGTTRGGQVWTSGVDRITMIGSYIHCNSKTDYGIVIHDNSDDCFFSGNNIRDFNTAAYSYGSGSRNLINMCGKESANAENPQLEWPIGSVIDFIDSGDGSGDGHYIKDIDGDWDKID